MEAIGTLAGGIAHDFNNILGVIVGNADLAVSDIPEGNPAGESLAEIRRAGLRAKDLVGQILLTARKKEHRLSVIRISPIVKEALKMLRASFPSTVEIRQHIGPDLPPILADPSQVQQVILNLCTNAAQAMEPDGGLLEVRLEAVTCSHPLSTPVGDLPEGRYLCLVVSDTGPGIPAAIRERIFEPYFTTKGVGKGSGLGLAVVQGIVHARGGGVIVESDEGHGTAIRVYFPASREAAAEAPAEEPAEPYPGTERILFVDDEPAIIALGDRILTRLGYAVEARASGTDALACFSDNPKRFDLVVTDMTMPHMTGDELARRILAIRPDIPVILCTGYSSQVAEEKAKGIGVREVVMKPLTAATLAQTVREVLDRRGA
jgi:CheY-like chemotaxis protein